MQTRSLLESERRGEGLLSVCEDEGAVAARPAAAVPLVCPV
jgi:hypothetical protein